MNLTRNEWREEKKGREYYRQREEVRVRRKGKKKRRRRTDGREGGDERWSTEMSARWEFGVAYMGDGQGGEVEAK